MKTRLQNKTRRQSRSAAAQRAEIDDSANRSKSPEALQRHIDDSAAMQRQQEQLQSCFGQAVQRAEFDDDDEDLDRDTLQGKFAPTQRETRPAQSTDNSGLPGGLKSGIESLSGMDMSDTRVHYNSPEPAKMDAHAYAQGRDIHLASGQEQHLPHEAWHVVQQQQGRVQPTMELDGARINDDPALEREADVMGSKANKYET